MLIAGIIGAVPGVLSPAIIVPAMSKLIDEGWGTKKGIPQMMIAVSPADDVYVVVIFTARISLSQGGEISAAQFLQVPVAILLGIALGGFAGFVLVLFFKRFPMRDTVKVIVLLSTAFLFVTLEETLKETVAVSGLLAVMSMGVTGYNRYDILAKRITGKFSKMWVPSEILLFRLAGTYLCVAGTKLNGKERVCCMISQIPKATVQAAIGGVALAKGLPCEKYGADRCR